MIGQILGNRYELIEKIGGGGMAHVYKAKCRLLNRFVAIKILKSDFIDDEEFLKRFRVEAQAAASLSHPNIVSIYDVGQESDIHYIVMEYVNGMTLKNYLDEKGVLDWEEAVDITIKIALAIEHAHKNHIIHRDIKPHNILFTKDGMVKVTDFGIARAVSSSTITMAGNTIGSVHYFSPEQARGGFTDERSDLYSVGIVLFELLTGKLPFEGESPVAVALKHLQEQPPKVVEFNPNVPNGVNSIVMRAIQKEQSIRYQSASELLNDLGGILKEPNTQFVKPKITEDSPTVRMPSIGKSQLGNFKNADEGISKKTGDKNVSKKKEKTTTVLAVATSLLIIGIIIVFIVKGLSPIVHSLFGKSEDFIVQDYTNQNYFEVKGKLSEYEILVEEVRKNDDSIPKDVIIEQDRAEGERIKPGGYARIKFIVSDGPMLLKMKDYRRQEYRKVVTELEQLGLRPSVVDEHNEGVAKGYVIKTEPDINEETKPDSIVKVYRSLGPEIFTKKVPNLLGKNKSEALALLTGANLSIGNIYPKDTTYVMDKIIKQDPKAGTEVEEGTPVNIFLEDYNPDQRDVDTLITLDNPSEYGDDINVLVNATRSDTNRMETVYSATRKKSEFPIVIPITIPNGGSAQVHVYLDNSLYKEYTENF
ncbi:MAG: Stk1 family PASTA domain-containing Ser/Thr kinase [Clostridium sp.]|nr:Stk1 family PASTA domain-containing Ser/Thr kinase [Clostridium sp.]